MSEHTPGPWYWGDDWSSFDGEIEKYMDFQLYGAGGVEIIPIRVDHRDFMWDTPAPDLHPRKFDRALIAAAPELLKSLKEMVRYADSVRYTAGMGKNQAGRLELAKWVIGKAEGKL